MSKPIHAPERITGLVCSCGPEGADPVVVQMARTLAAWARWEKEATVEDRIRLRRNLRDGRIDDHAAHALVLAWAERQDARGCPWPCEHCGRGCCEHSDDEVMACGGYRAHVCGRTAAQCDAVDPTSRLTAPLRVRHPT